jgi:hypothetical protein
MILTGLAERARATRHLRTLPQRLLFPSQRMDGRRPRRRAVTRHLPCGTAAGLGTRAALSHAEPVPGGAGRERPTRVAGGRARVGALRRRVPGLRSHRGWPGGAELLHHPACFRSGCQFMPADRHKMVRGPKRMQGPPIACAKAAELTGLPEARVVELIPRQEDGLHAQCWSVPVHGVVLAPPPSGSAQFQLVMAGTMCHQDAWLHAWESRYLSPEEPAQQLRAGAGDHKS